MFGKKKTTGTATPVPQVSNKKKIEDYLTSMSFLSHFVIDKKESLVEEEIKTVREIDKVKDSYTDVIEHNASIRETVDSLQKEFGKIGEISGQFTDVITDVTSVSDDAMQDIRDHGSSGNRYRKKVKKCILHHLQSYIFRNCFDTVHTIGNSLSLLWYFKKIKVELTAELTGLNHQKNSGEYYYRTGQSICPVLFFVEFLKYL